MSGPNSSSSSSTSSSLLPSLLSPTNLLPSYTSIDHYSLRHLILSRSGLPDHPSWLRSQGWKVLLGFLGPEKKEWPRQEAKKRGEYYELLGDLLPEGGEERGEGRYDALMTQIHLDVVRSRFAQSFSFFRQPVTPSASCPLAPLPSSSKSDGVEPVKRLEKRNALRQRLVALGHIEAGQADDDDDANATPPRSDAILRILFLYALLNPSVGYVQGMVEVAAVVVWTIGSATGMPTTTEEGGGSDGFCHFEADSFWCFSLLLGELRELWDFEGLDSTRAGLRIRNSRDSPGAPAAATGLGGMARALRSLGGRLRWADEELWRHLYDNGLSPSIPYYSFRWLATLLATSLPLPSLVRVWDVILCEAGSANANAAGPSSSSSSSNSQHSQRVDFLLDVVTSLLIFHRQNLLAAIQHHDGGDEEQQEDIFSRCMTFLQDLPDRDDDIGPVLESASMLRQRRIAADLTGEGGPADDESVKVEPMEGSSGAAGSATMGAKARTAFNRWASSSGSGSSGTSSATTTKGGWLRSVSATRDARSDSTSSSAAAAAITTTTSPPPSLLNRLQSSDAAAELSKVGTNWQALAMDKWAQAQARRSASESHAPQAPSSPSESVTSSGTGSSSAFASNLSSRFAALGWGSVGSSTANRNGKARAFSTSSSPRIQHPAVMQWSQGASANGSGGADGMPNFPLPDVMDSPDGRTEYAYVRPASMMMTGLGLGSISPVVDRVQQQQQQRRGVGVGTIPEEWRSTSTPSRGGSDRSPSLGFTSSSMSSTSSTGSAAGVNGTPRGAGPKPLLLAGSARAAVVPSADEVHNSTPPAPPSKVVRTGPLAGGSPYTPRGTQRQRGQRKRFGETSFDSSIGGGGGGDESVDGDAADSSVVDLLATPGKTVSNSGGGGGGGRDSKDGREASLATSTSLQAALNTEGALPNLPSLRAAKAAGVDTTTITKPTTALRGENGVTSGENGSGDGESTVGGPSTSSRLAGGLRAASGRGTVPAGAFSQASSNSSSNNDAQRPAFGSIASSSDVPLVSTEARGSVRRRPPSSSRVLEEAGGVALAEGEDELPSSSVPGSPVVADNSSIRSAASSKHHPAATRRGAVRRRSTQPIPPAGAAAAPADQVPTTPTLPSASIAPATPSSSSRDSEYRRRGSYEVDDDSPRDRLDQHDAPPQLSHGQGDSDFASSTTIGRKIYTLVDEPVNLTSSTTATAPPASATRRSLTHSQSHDSPPVAAPPPAKLNRRSASSVRSSASSAGSGERTVGSTSGGGPIVRSKRSFKTGAKTSSSSSSKQSTLPTPRSPLTQDAPTTRSLASSEDTQPQQPQRIDEHDDDYADIGTTTADSLASTRTTAESLPSSSPPSSVVSSPFARGHQALPSIDAQLYADAGGEERRIDELPTSAARFDEEDAFVDHADGRTGSGHAGGGEGYEYYEYFGDEHDPHGGPHRPRHEEPEGMDLPEDEENEDGDGMAAIGSAFRQFSAGMAGSGGDVRRDSAGGIRF